MPETTTLELDTTAAVRAVEARLRPILEASADLAETIAGVLNDAEAQTQDLASPASPTLLDSDQRAELTAALDAWRDSSAEVLGELQDRQDRGR